MLAQINLFSLVLSPVLFYMAGAAIVMLLSHFKIIKADA